MGTEAGMGAIVEEYRAMRDRLTALNVEVGAMTASARSADRSVVATVGAQGELVHLEIDPVLAGRLDTTALASRVLEASTLAIGQVRDRLQETLRATLPARFGDLIGPDGLVRVERLLPADPTDLLRR